MRLESNIFAATSHTLLVFSTVLAVLGFAMPASAQTLKTLHAFCAKANCADGADPQAGLVSDLSGNLYGTTAAGGEHGGGTVFSLTQTGAGKYKFDVLYSFCAKKNCADGSMPRAGLIVDASGNLYGTTQGGGAHNGGSIFALKRAAHGDKATLRTVYSFCTADGCTDGFAPQASLTYAGAATGTPYDGVSTLYGTTMQGGAQSSGTVYQVTPSSKGAWAEKAIYSFCSYGFSCSDGTQAYAGLIVDVSGNLYGTTYGGGDHGNGVVFELTPDTQKLNWTQTVLHGFGASPDGTDGENPIGGLLMDSAGSLYGTTTGGGANCDGNFGCGVAFKLIPNGTQSQLTVIYNFCSQANCADGSSPQASMLMDSSGNLFGTTYQGGAHGQTSGTVYSLNGSLRTIQNFCSKKNCGDGQGPIAGVTMDSGGNLFGTTSAGGGKNKAGTVFELTP